MSGKGDTTHDLLRVVDANLNRAAEALRVVEDCARFVLDHAGLTNTAKSMRHRLRMAVTAIPGADIPSLLAARDTTGDVGTQLVGAGERERAEWPSVLRANFQRLVQSLRVLEEYAKLLGGSSQAFETLRYDAYTLEKQFSSPPARPVRLEDKPLMVLVGTWVRPGADAAHVVETSRRVLEGGGRLIQLREKEMPDGECLDLARELRELTRKHDAVLIVNDRVDVASASGADGVHLGLGDLPLEEARRILGPSKLVGLTAHSLQELADAERQGADYIGVGTMFRSPTKPDLEVKGPEELLPAAARCPTPCYAIGGVGRENLEKLLKSGARRVAVGSAITASADPAAETAWFLDKLRQV